MSEGLEVLRLINSRGGCLLSELAIELGIPKSSVISWVSMFCSTGYLKRDGEEPKVCSCRNSGITCVCCSCSCDGQHSNEPRVELTERGRAFIRRNSDEKNRSETISGNGRLSRNHICA